MNHIRTGSDYPSLDPGDLRHQLTFLKQTVGSDESGANFNWLPTAFKTFAKIEILDAKDVQQQGQTISQTVSRVTIRWDNNPAIRNTSRFQDENGAIWIIEAIRNIGGRNVLLEMTCLGLGENNS